MWIKLFLLLLYLLVLFLVSRLLEAAAWYDTGFLSYRILDPFALSVKKLKKLLESRGVNYAGFIEKKDLTHLVQASGDVTEGELLEVTSEEDTTNSSAPSTVHFTSGSHFYEEVEDTKDSVWLVQVIPPSASPLLDDLIWHKLHYRIAPFGVRLGVFDCSVDRRLCNKRGWHVPQLILAIPKGHRAKDSVILHSYPVVRHPIRLQLILDWMQEHLMSRVHEVASAEELRDEWLNYGEGSKRSEVRLLLFSALLDPPLFLLALGVRFSGRVRVGVVHVRDREKSSKEMQDVGVNRLPCYLVVTPEKVFVYGQRIGEYFTYRRMECFLKALRPETNDVFLLSLAIVNVFGLLNFFFVEDSFLRHAIFCLWRLGRANCILFLVWLLILGLGQLKFMDYLSEVSLTAIRTASGSTLAALMRNDWQCWKNSARWILPSLLAFCVAGSWIHRRRATTAAASGRADDPRPPSSSSSPFSDWWSLSLDSYLMDCFFRPIATFSQPLSPGDLDLEEGMEMLIERLAVPNFWLQPVISSDYIKDLPVWVQPYRKRDPRGVSESEDATTDVTSEDEMTSGTVSESPNESAASSRPEAERHAPGSCSESAPDGCPGRNSSARKPHGRRSPCPPADASAPPTMLSALGHEPPSGMLDCYECAICLERYRSGIVLCGLPCGHNYHQHCIVPWLLRDNHHCPVCRWPTYKSKPLSSCSVHLHTE